MADLALFATIVREALTRERIGRVPEPDLVMDDPDKVAAFTRAGREDGVMAPVYLFHCAQMCEVIRPGDLVIDLGCGPGTQIAMVARLHREARFLGIDLSEGMLARARDHARAVGATNLEFACGDITRLDFLADASVDVVCSTVALHQLPDLDALERTLAEVARVLKPGGGLYIVDFTRLKSARAIDYFANQYADRQPELFTLDYLNSLRAAFTLEEFSSAVARHLQGRALLHAMFMLRYMAAIKSPARSAGLPALRERLRLARGGLPAHHAADLRNLSLLFRLGGMRSGLL
jgi:arsenite methyltransferase